MQTNLALVKYHGYSHGDIENMYPWERLVTVDMIAAKMKEETMEQQDMANMQKDINNFVQQQQRFKRS